MIAREDDSPICYAINDLTVDFARHSVERGGRAIDLNKLSFDLLRLLVISAPETVTYDELAEKVWGRPFVSQEAIAQRVKLLRQALSEDGAHPRYIETVRGKGYRLKAPAQPVPSRRGDARRWRWFAAALVGSLVLVGLVLLLTRAPTGRPSTAAGLLPKSVAVLPLENLSPDPDNAHIAAGLHEEILNQLSRLHGLKVISRSSVQRFAQNARPIPEVARQLNVEAVMEGSVRYAEDRIRVSVQLIDGRTDQHLWSEIYDREFDDIFAIQSDIAVSVANALEAEFSDEERQQIEQPPTDSSAAYALFLQAITLNVAGTGRVAEAHELLDRAIAIDPEFSWPYAVKADLSITGLVDGALDSTQSWAALAPRVRENAQIALQLDPNSALALNALGNLAALSWHWSEARARYDQAYQRGFRSGHGTPFWFRAWSGDQAEAIEIVRQRVDLSPFAWSSHFFYGILLHYAHDYGAAAATFRDGIALAPALPLNHAWLAWTEIGRRNAEEAERALELTEQLLGENRPIGYLLHLAYGYGRIGDADNARRLFDEVSVITAEGRDIGAGGWALTHLSVGNASEALEWLERGVQKARRHEPDVGFYALMNIRMNATNDPLLERPEFVDVRERLRGD